MKIEGGTFLVTGGAGFIPSHLIEMLLDKGAGRVVSFDNFSRGRNENLSEALKSEKFDFYEGDLRDTKLLNKINNYLYMEVRDWLYEDGGLLPLVSDNFKFEKNYSIKQEEDDCYVIYTLQIISSKINNFGQ